MAISRLLGTACIFLGLVSIAHAQSTTPVLPYTNGLPVSNTNPMPVTPLAGGTPQNVNITKIQGAAPSLTNPLWMMPATGALWAVTQSTSPWIIAGGGTAGSAAAGVATVQGIASMTPILIGGTGTAGSSATAVVTVQGITSGTALPVSGAFYQATQPVSIASAQVASGAYASGAFASGSLASGAMVDLLTMRGTKGPGTAAANSILAGGVYNATPPTIVDGQQAAIQLDSDGSTYVQVRDWAGGQLGAMANYGTTPGAVLVPGVNAYVTSMPAPTQALGITPTDRTITSATGSSQTVAALNTSRHGLIVQNTGNANCGVNPTGGTAVIGGAGTLTLVPNGSYQPRIPTLSAITAICAAGQPLYVEEN